MPDILVHSDAHIWSIPIPTLVIPMLTSELIPMVVIPMLTSELIPMVVIPMLISELIPIVHHSDASIGSIPIPTLELILIPTSVLISKLTWELILMLVIPMLT
jgi:hypothetical protein